MYRERKWACFDDDADLPKLVQRYLDDPIAREEILLKGQARAYRDHTYDQRVEALLQMIQ